MATRGATVQVPAYLIPQTRIEQRKKKETAAAKKEQDKLEAENKLEEKHRVSTGRIATFLDSQADMDANISTINPDTKVVLKSRQAPCKSRSTAAHIEDTVIPNNDQHSLGIAGSSDVDMVDRIGDTSDKDPAFVASSDNFSSDEDEQERLLREQLEAVKRAKKDRKKAEKVQVQNDVAGLQVKPPVAPVVPPANTRKRLDTSSSGSENPSGKRTKPNEVGGERALLWLSGKCEKQPINSQNINTNH
ncbi:hypothetical protein BDP27DRAFT_1452049 [Rhodocollybia butyracea]|uniref:Uncharacterized protein n=1 Tax=Rhodocollybia butyracea TaxID=206335 RepID=A0A9P5PEK0_9AGAR|nr:hypothetical protein BDP27DRAFT_1452049 [Rhodocollybia butyracea]